jgi:hypothetical protein
LDDVLAMQQLEPELDEGQASPAVVETPAPVAPAASAAQAVPAPAPAASPPSYQPIAPPPPEPVHDDSLPPQLLTIFLRPSADPDRDRRRIKNVYGILISQPGKDRFQFQIFENGKGHLIDFPNDTTRIGPELFERLKKLLGEETWRIEEITYQ